MNSIMVDDDFDIKAKVQDILQENDFDKKRARTMDIDDFLQLLEKFNKNGIHFA